MNPERASFEQVKDVFMSEQSSLFNGLSEIARGYLMVISDIVVKKKGDIIIREGDTAIDYMYILFDGELEVVKDNKGILSFKPYECIGEMILIDVKHERRATIRVVSNSAELIRIPFRKMEKMEPILHEDHLKLNNNILGIMWERIQNIAR